MAIGRAVVYYARAAHAFSAGIKCRHCSDFGIPYLGLGLGLGIRSRVRVRARVRVR